MPHPSRTLARRICQLARYPVAGVPFWLLLVGLLLIALVDTCTGGQLSH